MRTKKSCRGMRGTAMAYQPSFIISFSFFSVAERTTRDKKIRQSWAPRTGTHDVPVDTTKTMKQ
jgi:hypothetical protein